jgi:LytR cell envelope-related transcriptional attenuator
MRRSNHTALAARRSPPARGGSPARITVLIVGAVLVGIAVVAAILLSGGGGSGAPSTANSSAARSASAAGAHARKTHAKTSRPAASTRSTSAGGNLAETNVVVLNGTNTTGLAHRVSGELRQSGYSQATPLNGRPSGANQVTDVEYTSGHRADAEGVARSLGVAQAKPMEATVASLSGSATVVVIVGLDKAATVP